MNRRLLHRLPVVLLALWLIAGSPSLDATGVTVITHGFNSDVASWIIPMIGRIPPYPGFPGTNSTCYQVSITSSSGQYVTTPTFLAGTNPFASDSGEILIKLDWSTLSGFGGPSTMVIASNAAAALLATNFIAELGGHALAELPLHFVGHSRGASVVAEMARLLGAQGIWVDQVTTLDPHPVPSLGDPVIKNFANVLFADNYWQNMGDGLFVPNGQAVAGAYNRQLTNLSGGNSSSHSDTHLWYHGTIDFSTPITVDSATITTAERTNWWATLEQRGTNAGFRLSLIGGGDRLSTAEPAGAGSGHIRDGFNKVWDLGDGVSPNRDALPANNGAWPNVIRFNLTAIHALAVGEPIPISFHHQSGSNPMASAELRVFLDRDTNPWDSNEVEVLQTTLAGTGTNQVALVTTNVQPDPSAIPPGNYRVFARLNAGARTRYLYAPQTLTLTPSRLPPTLTALGHSNGEFRVRIDGTLGQRIVTEASSDLADWIAIATNTLSGVTVDVLDAQASGFDKRYYRAQLGP